MVYGKQRIEGLIQEVKDAFYRAIPALEALPFDVMVFEGPRPALTQIAYCAQGRLTPGEVNGLRAVAGLNPTMERGIITNVDGMLTRSPHQGGRAVDVVPMKDGNLNWNAPEDQWLLLGKTAKQFGFRWGGDWKKHPAAVLGWDCPHWEM